MRIQIYTVHMDNIRWKENGKLLILSQLLNLRAIM